MRTTEWGRAEPQCLLGPLQVGDRVRFASGRAQTEKWCSPSRCACPALPRPRPQHRGAGVGVACFRSIMGAPSRRARPRLGFDLV